MQIADYIRKEAEERGISTINFENVDDILISKVSKHLPTFTFPVYSQKIPYGCKAMYNNGVLHLDSGTLSSKNWIPFHKVEPDLTMVKNCINASELPIFNLYVVYSTEHLNSSYTNRADLSHTSILEIEAIENATLKELQKDTSNRIKEAKFKRNDMQTSLKKLVYLSIQIVDCNGKIISNYV